MMEELRRKGPFVPGMSLQAYMHDMNCPEDMEEETHEEH